MTGQQISRLSASHDTNNLSCRQQTHQISHQGTKINFLDIPAFQALLINFKIV